MLQDAIAESGVKKTKLHWQVLAEQVSSTGTTVHDYHCFLKYNQLRYTHLQKSMQENENIPLKKTNWTAEEVRCATSCSLCLPRFVPL